MNWILRRIDLLRVDSVRIRASYSGPGVRSSWQSGGMENRTGRRCVGRSFAAVGLVVIAVATVCGASDDEDGHVARHNVSGHYSSRIALVDVTLVEGAVTKGAVCLDGTPPAYNLQRGFGSGANNWLVHLEGGGWCNNVTSCFLRKHGHLGSSNYMRGGLFFSGILSGRHSQNPDFYNWNRVKVRYCDGASFTGDVEEVDPVYKLHYRGKRIWRAVIDDLLVKGMRNAKQALLSGCSAGGLASILHCDNFRKLLPKTATVKCLGDAGFFINLRDISGAHHIRSYFNDVFTLQQSIKSLPAAYISEVNPTEYFFPEYLLPYIRTPLFILNTAYDSWQIRNILVPYTADPHGHWHSCKLDVKNCSRSQLEILQGFRLEMLSALKIHENSKSGGMFINSCYAHCQTERQMDWFADDSPRLKGKAIAQAVGDWFFDRSNIKEIDCPYPCDSTCQNLVYTQD